MVSAFGRNRDSNTRPRYSWVIPRWRPWPAASITVTPHVLRLFLDGIAHGLDPLAEHNCLYQHHPVSSAEKRNEAPELPEGEPRPRCLRHVPSDGT